MPFSFLLNNKSKIYNCNRLKTKITQRSALKVLLDMKIEKLFSQMTQTGNSDDDKVMRAFM